ncbi:uncharacterized protein N7483_001282 [Penicillium malachiteum]|uniref:uncharacterized protein n=1 Tax=Penicillium malachiteum TaxID=1324776 RepID=UPI002547CA61|nr:uncharacterized protein N7483_001282 [Penicillium malachiteum]KAJ5736157.1 hypothetical protein N7483_001282 [Penicillium malachiteum]
MSSDTVVEPLDEPYKKLRYSKRTSDRVHPRGAAGTTAIALGATLGTCIVFTFLFIGLIALVYRKRKQSSPEERLAKLNTTSPVLKLEEWWSKKGRKLGSFEALDRLFNW